MITVDLHSESGRLLNARIEVDGSDVIVHSRSGAGPSARNPDYREALELVLERLLAEKIRPDVFLDSAPVKSVPLENRRLLNASELTGDIPDQFNLIVRKTNAGSSSHGAWRRLRLRVANLPEYALISILSGAVKARSFGIPIEALDQVQRRHLDVAIMELRSGRERPTRFERATGYELSPPDGGPSLPPKKVFGIALAEALQTHINPNDFSSGETIFRIMRDRGIEVRPVPGVVWPRTPALSTPNGGDPTTVPLPPTPEERRWIEGDIRFVSHMRRERSGTLPNQFKADCLVSQGRFVCDRCGRDYLDEFAAAVVGACFEVHHIQPIAQMDAGHETTPDQLQLLCANCHRVTHREMLHGLSEYTKANTGDGGV